MTENQKNDLFYVCSMIEYVARKTKNHRKDIVLSLGKKVNYFQPMPVSA